MDKTTIKLQKPIYLGMSILDLSKTLMYNFHYNHIKKKYDDRANLLFTDTDSLCYEITTKNFYEDIANDVPTWFDTSNYPKTHKIFTGKNKKVIRFMKDEADGQQSEESVGLRSKLYAFKIHDCDSMCDNIHCDGPVENLVVLGGEEKSAKALKKQ